MPANPMTDGEITPASYSPCGLADHARRLTQHRGPPRFSNTPGMKMRDALVTHSLCATCGRVWLLASAYPTPNDSVVRPPRFRKRDAQSPRYKLRAAYTPSS
jgi:hypothetical protein